MKEDIKILEEFKKSIKNFNNYADNSNVSLITKRQVKAIENLLARYKEVKEENKELKSDNYELNNRINDLLDSVPKSIIEEKIEELQEKDKESETNIYGYGIHFLQELLEKGE